jgi:ribose transport system permease protein
MIDMMEVDRTPHRWLNVAVPLQRLFVRLGVLPFLLIIALVVFTALSSRFLTSDNLLTVARQATYLAIVAMGQMLALLTGGFDLSVGKIVAITSVVAALVMSPLAAAHPAAVAITMTLGIVASIAAGTMVGVVNGVGVAVFGVSPFMMTLGTATISFGIALTLTSGVPVYGIPDEFGTIFTFSRILDVPSPVYVTAGLFVAMHVLLNWTRMGRYFYAVGGNLKAAHLSGISTRFYLFMAYVLCGALASVSGVLLTARLGTGEANIGASLPLDSIAACVIGGVSLRGGAGRLGNVVLGAIFIGLIQNGMDLAQIQSYLQEVVIGILLILAVIADQLRQYVMLRLKD